MSIFEWGDTSGAQNSSAWENVQWSPWLSVSGYLYQLVGDQLVLCPPANGAFVFSLHSLGKGVEEHGLRVIKESRIRTRAPRCG